MKQIREGIERMAADMGVTLDQVLTCAEQINDERSLASLQKAVDESLREREDARTLRWLRMHAVQMAVRTETDIIYRNLGPFESPEEFDREVREAMARSQS